MATSAVKTTTHYQIASDTVEKDKNKCYLVGPRKLPSFPTVFANTEDSSLLKGKVKFDDPDIERVRRGHLNDLENILPFFTVAFFYTLTNPTEFLAVNLFRVYTLARILHTFVYTIVVTPQPSRFLVFVVGYVVTIYMALQVILHFL